MSYKIEKHLFYFNCHRNDYIIEYKNPGKIGKCKELEDT